MSDTTDAVHIDPAKLKASLIAAKNDSELFSAIVNAPFIHKVETTFMFLGIVVLLQVNKKTGNIDRVALSNTELAKQTTNVSYVKFSEIKIPASFTENIIAKAIETGDPQDTIDWKFLFIPAMTAEQARINQASAGIAYSVVYPLKSRDGGALIFSYFQYPGNIGKSHRDFMKHYTSIVDKALARPQTQGA